MSLRAKLSAIFMILFTVSIGNILFTFAMERFAEEKLSWVVHTQTVLQEAERLLSSMTDAETGQRGFLLTGDVAYLAPYHRGQIEATNAAKKLEEMTRDNPEQVERMGKIALGMTEKFDELARTIDLRQSSSSENQAEALDLVMSSEGKIIMDGLRRELADFKTTERVLLETRNGDYRESKAYVMTVLAVEVLFFIFLAITTAFFIKDKLFGPMNLLLESTAKMERGEKQDISNMLPSDEMGYLISRFYKMSEQVYHNTEELTYDATHDTLTDLKNRAGLNTVVRDSILSLVGTNRKSAVIFIDLNKFKQLNDTLGHDVGDEILKETAARLERSVRADDEVFRLGGDEFVIVLASVGEISHIRSMVPDILGQFKSPFVHDGKSIEISLSMGIAVTPDDSADIEEILKLADRAMYAAKADETTNYKFFDTTMLINDPDIHPIKSIA